MTDIANRKRLYGPMMVIAAFTVIAALKIGSAILAPVVLALTTGVILAPAISFFRRLGLPTGAAAGTLLLLFIVGFTGLFLLLEPVVWTAVERIPSIWYELQSSLHDMQDMLRGIKEVTDNVAGAINLEAAEAGPQAAAEGEGSVQMPTAIDAISLAPAIAAEIMVFIGVLFFFLFTRDQIYLWLGRTMSGGDEGENERIKTSLVQAEHMVSRYFLTITLINACLGLAVAAVMAAFGLASPILWGLGAFTLNFIPYLGPAVFAVLLTLGGIVAFDGILAVLPVGAYLCMNVTEGQFVTPSLVGKRLSVNPLAIFLSLISFVWLWGALGGFVAIPVLLWVLLISGLLKPSGDLLVGAEHVANAVKDPAE